MKEKTRHIAEAKRLFGRNYPAMGKLTRATAQLANIKRAKLFNSIFKKLNSGSQGSRIFCGKQSPGCVACGEGKWSCLFLTGICTANCFFCPKPKDNNLTPYAEGLTFSNPQDYVDYLKIFNFRAVGISGGDPLAKFDKLLLYLSKIKKEFGKKIYLWIYTNGNLVDRKKLTMLKRSGVDEIKFDICAINYDLRPVQLALKYIKNVIVEIPVIPEDLGKLKTAVKQMEKIGVNYLNIHQLVATPHNCAELIKRNYTFLHYPGNPILESEFTALKLLNYALEKNIKLPIHYCPPAYDAGLKRQGARKRLAPFVIKKHEHLTFTGYIRRISKIAKKGQPVKGYQLEYFLPELKEKASPGAACLAVRLRSGRKLFVARTKVLSQKLDRVSMAIFKGIYVDRRDPRIIAEELGRGPARRRLKAYLKKLSTLRKYEKMPIGSPELY